MSRKTKINVLLPFKMVGELERLSKIGKRSGFIHDAIRARLDAKEDYNITDYSDEQLARVLHNRIQLQNDYKSTPLSLLLLELIE